MSIQVFEAKIVFRTNGQQFWKQTEIMSQRENMIDVFTQGCNTTYLCEPR